MTYYYIFVLHYYLQLDTTTKTNKKTENAPCTPCTACTGCTGLLCVDFLWECDGCLDFFC